MRTFNSIILCTVLLVCSIVALLKYFRIDRYVLWAIANRITKWFEPQCPCENCKEHTIQDDGSRSVEYID